VPERVVSWVLAGADFGATKGKGRIHDFVNEYGPLRSGCGEGPRQRAAAGGVVAGKEKVQIPRAANGKGHRVYPVAFVVAGGGFEPPTFGL
jgi:hypothetical protein